MVALEWYSTFESGGVRRMGFLWENPNLAGVMLALGLPLCWALDRAWTRPSAVVHCREIVLRIMECLLLVAVVSTLSRAAILATGIALIYHAGILWRAERAARKQILVVAMLRVALICVMVLVSGAGRRFADVTKGDRSVVNRVEIWSGAAQMIKIAPLQGWGEGRSGLEYGNWFQPLTQRTVPGTMVNTYLTIAVEHGVVVPCFLIGSILLLSMMVLGNGEQNPMWRAAVCGLVLWACAAGFNTVAGFKVSCALTLCVIAFVAIYKRRNSTTVVVSRAIAGAVLPMTLIAATIAVTADKNAGYSVSHDKSGRVSLRFEGSTGPTAVLLTDTMVLGPDYGKAVRAAFKSAHGRISSVVVVTNGQYIPKDCNADVAIYFGSRAQDKEMPETASRIAAAVVAPWGSPPNVPAERFRKLVLPSADENGFNAAWTIWAGTKLPVKTIPLCGTYLGHILGEILVDCLFDGRKSIR